MCAALESPAEGDLGEALVSVTWVEQVPFALCQPLLPDVTIKRGVGLFKERVKVTFGDVKMGGNQINREVFIV